MSKKLIEIAIEVKSRRVKSLHGMEAFLGKYPKASRLVVGGSGVSSCSLEEFLCCENLDAVIGLLG